MSNFISSSLRVYPSSESSTRSYKVSTEYNLTRMVRDISRNKVISGLTITCSGNSITEISAGSAYISGYRITIYLDYTFSTAIPASDDSYIYLRLNRKNEGDENLNGDSGTDYTGLSILVAASGSIPADDCLILAKVVGGNAVALNSSSKGIFAQDIYVFGNNGDNPKVNDYDNDDKNKSARLDDYLAKFIISDGQFFD